MHLDVGVNQFQALILVALCSVLLVSVSSAQVEKRVVFAKGKTSATYTGKLPRNYADYDAYVLRAKRGQTLTVKLTSSDANAHIAVYETKVLGADEDLISAGGDEFPRVWSGKLPVTSEFSVQVYGARVIEQTSNRAAYTIEITIH